MSYQTVGQGEPILLINGYGGTGASWNPQFIQELAKDHTVITFDVRGMGNTTLGKMESTIEQMAKDTYQLIKKLDIKPDILGHSMGGFIAQVLALEHPESVDKLILSSTNCGSDQTAYPPSDEILLRYKNMSSKSKGMKAIYDGVAKWNTTCDSLQNIKNPTLVLVGTEDEFTPMGNSLLLDEKIPNSKLIKIENGTHRLTHQFPDEIASVVNTFIR